MVTQNSTNNYATSSFIVDATAGSGNYTTITLALAAASSGDTIFIKPGTYTENLTLKAGVNLASYACEDLNGTVSIVGKATFSSAGTVSITGVELKTNGDYCLVVSGANASIVLLSRCTINCNDNAGISFTSSNASSIINFYYCQGNTGGVTTTYYSSSSAGEMTFDSCSFANSGSTTTASSNSAGIVNIVRSTFSCPLATSATGGLGIVSSWIPTQSINTTTCALAGSGVHSLLNSILDGGTATAITIGAASTLTAYNSTINSTNSNAISGAGVLNYNGLVFGNSSQKISTTTQTGGLLKGGQTQAPSAGFIGEIIESKAAANSVAMVTSTAKTITSVSLTPGIWDCSGVVQYSGSAGTGVVCFISIGTVNNTIATLADAALQVGTGPTIATNDESLSIAGVRFTLTSTTTIYLVGQITITAGTVNSGGRLSAVRVG